MKPDSSRWQPRNHDNRSSHLHLKNELIRGLSSESNLRAIHAEHAGVAARGGAGRSNAGTGQESEFHQARGQFFRQFDSLDYAGFPFAEIPEPAAASVLETQL